MKYDTYTSILLLILIIAPIKLSIKELFDNNNTTQPTVPTASTASTASTAPIVVKDGIILADIPKPTATFLQDTVKPQTLINEQVLGIDDRFKTDDVAVKEILRQIKSQVDYDPYKTNLGKETIYEIYNKYFDNDVFVKLKNVNDDSKTYLAAGNFEYVPTVAQVDYDLITYQNLSNNIQFGVNPLSDGINNKTKINRG